MARRRLRWCSQVMKTVRRARQSEQTNAKPNSKQSTGGSERGRTPKTKGCDNIGAMKGRESTALILVLAGLVPAIHALSGRDKDVGARIKSAQDDSKSFPARPTQVHLAR